MVETLRHESFYVSGTWSDPAQGTYVGWVALKNSFAESMPIRNQRDNTVLVFSGEEYSKPQATPCSNHQRNGANGAGPAYLLELYKQDLAFPAGLNGRFHGLVASRGRCETTIFNDRYGMQRLYYHESREAFYFAAEAKAILAVCPELRVADPRALGELVTCGCVLENRSLFKGLFVLPPASAWLFQNGSLIRKGSYFDPHEWENQSSLEANAFCQEVIDVFTRNLPRYFTGHQPIANSLTGGLDSRMIMAWQKEPPNSLPCYTFGGPLRECRDVTTARRVAQACQQPHTVIPVGTEFLSRFPQYAERTIYMTDGCASVNHSADLYVNALAREIAPVRMTGNYGGEVLRRVRAFKPVEPPAGLFPELAPYTRQASDTYARLTQSHPLSFTVFRQAPWHHYGLLALEQTQLTLRTPFLDNELVGTAFRAPTAACLDDVSRQVIEQGGSLLRQIPTDIGIGGKGGGLSETLRRKFLKLTFRAEYAYDSGMPQWMARIDHALAPLHLERLFLGRHKFLHYRIWYRDFLSGYIREMLLDRRTLSRPYLQENNMRNIVRGHLKEGRNYTSEINIALTLELVHRLFLDPQ
jgi:asparagine synthase (glutamine-hydrolysing)